MKTDYKLILELFRYLNDQLVSKAKPKVVYS